MSKTRKVLLMLLALAVLKPLVDLLLAAMLPDGAVNPVPQCIGGMLAALLLLFLPAWLQRPWTSPRLAQQKVLWPGVAAAAIAAVLTRAALTPADAAWQAALSVAPEALPAPESIPLGMLYLAALVVVPALTEEAFFRGALLTGLLDGARRMTAVLVTTAAFTLIHGSLANLPSLLVLSLLLTLLMLYSGHIAVPMTAHLIYNLTALNWVNVPGWGSILCGAGLITLGVYLSVRQPKYAHPPMRLPDALLAAGAVAVAMLSCLL